MPGTQDYLIRQAQERADRAKAAREAAGRAQASGGGTQRFADAQREEAAANSELASLRSKLGR